METGDRLSRKQFSERDAEPRLNKVNEFLV